MDIDGSAGCDLANELFRESLDRSVVVLLVDRFSGDRYVA